MRTIDKINVRLCMGSSCYSRGNDQILNLIRTYLSDMQLNELVDFRGHLCQKSCAQGPNLIIDNKEFNEVSESTILLILQDCFEKKESGLTKPNSTPHTCTCEELGLENELPQTDELHNAETPQGCETSQQILLNRCIPIFRNKPLKK